MTDTVDTVEAAGSNDRGVVFVMTNANDETRGNEVVMYRRATEGVRVPVRWQDQATVGALAGQPVLVQMQPGTLYALCL